MTSVPQATPVEQIADTRNEKNQAMALRLVNGLVGQIGLAPTMAVLSIAWMNGAAAILHAASPIPEVNIKSLYELADGLRDMVAAHEDCAKRLGAGAVVSEDGEIAEPRIH